MGYLPARGDQPLTESFLDRSLEAAILKAEKTLGKRSEDQKWRELAGNSRSLHGQCGSHSAWKLFSVEVIQLRWLPTV